MDVTVTVRRLSKEATGSTGDLGGERLPASRKAALGGAAAADAETSVEKLLTRSFIICKWVRPGMVMCGPRMERDDCLVGFVSKVTMGVDGDVDALDVRRQISPLPSTRWALTA